MKTDIRSNRGTVQESGKYERVQYASDSTGSRQRLKWPGAQIQDLALGFHVTSQYGPAPICSQVQTYSTIWYQLVLLYPHFLSSKIHKGNSPMLLPPLSYFLPLPRWSYYAFLPVKSHRLGSRGVTSAPCGTFLPPEPGYLQRKAVKG